MQRDLFIREQMLTLGWKIQYTVKHIYQCNSDYVIAII